MEGIKQIVMVEGIEQIYVQSYLKQIHIHCMSTFTNERCFELVVSGLGRLGYVAYNIGLKWDTSMYRINLQNM